MQPRSFASFFFISFYCRYDALSARSFSLEHIERTAEVQFDAKARVCRPVSSPHCLYITVVSALLPHTSPLCLTLVPFSVTMVMMQTYIQRHWCLWSSCACGGAAGEHQPDCARVSVVSI